MSIFYLFIAARDMVRHYWKRYYSVMLKSISTKNVLHICTAWSLQKSSLISITKTKLRKKLAAQTLTWYMGRHFYCYDQGRIILYCLNHSVRMSQVLSLSHKKCWRDLLYKLVRIYADKLTADNTQHRPTAERQREWLLWTPLQTSFARK